MRIGSPTKAFRGWASILSSTPGGSCGDWSNHKNAHTQRNEVPTLPRAPRSLLEKPDQRDIIGLSAIDHDAVNLVRSKQLLLLGAISLPVVPVSCPHVRK